MAVLCCCRGEKYRSAEGRIETPHPRFPTRPLVAGARNSPCPRPNGKAAAGLVTANTPRDAHCEVPLEDITLDPAVLDVDDSDEDNDGERRVTKHSSTSTLGGLKARFVRRLSQQTDSGSQVQHAVHTEEELARRAELKRIRHRRIQEELQMDREEEGTHKTPGRPASAPGSSGELSRVGPRDKIEFGVGPLGDLHPAVSRPLHVPAVPLSLPITEERALSLSRWQSSCSVPATRPSEHSSAAPHVHKRPMCSLPRLPSSSPPHSVPLPGDDTSPSFDSWRLSYSAGNIVISQEEDPSHGYQRISAQESSEGNTQSHIAADPDMEDNRDTMSGDVVPDMQNEAPHCETKLNDTVAAAKTASVKDVALWAHGEAVDSDSPLDLWVRVQAKALASDEPQRQINNDSHGLSPAATSSAVSHHDIRRGEMLPLTQGSTHLNDSVLLRASGPTPMNREHSQTSSQGSSGKLQYDNAFSELDGCPPCPRLGLSSSQHPTRPSNNKANPPYSYLDISGHLPRFHGIAQPQPKSCIVAPSRPSDLQISDGHSHKTAPAEETIPESAVAHVKCSTRRPTLDTRSVAGCVETASFKLREAELDSVARRFVSCDTPREPRTPIASKFREEFDRDNTAKSNLFTRFRVSKRSKPPRRRLAKGPPAEKGPHRNCVADALDASHRAAAHSRSRSASPRLNKAGRHDLEPSATDLWQRAARLELDRREALRKDKEKSTGGHQDEVTEKADVRRLSALPFLKESGSSKQQRPYDIPERYDDGSSRGNTTVGPGFYLYRKPRLPIIPSAWAKWPSHSRAERTGPAGKSNNVVPKDFATMGEPAAGERPAIPPKPSMPGSLVRTLRNSIAKIKPGNDVSPRSWKRLAREQEKEHRKFVGGLEYPELEIPPASGGTEELQALEEQINRIKHHAGLPGRLPIYDDWTARSKTPLSLRIAREMHQLRHEHEDVLVGPCDVLGSGNPKPAMTPKPSSAGSRQRLVSTATTERFLTPASHLSYEDDTPNQVLDDHGEGDSVKSAGGILVRQPQSDMEDQLHYPPKYLTWSGRAKTQPVLLKSTQEFGAELERMMAHERNKIMGSGSVDAE